MPRIDDYQCGQCGTVFEAMTMTSDESAACPSCGQVGAEALIGATHSFDTIVPMYNNSVRNKAGWVHKFQNRPAEKTSISVPRRGNTE